MLELFTAMFFFGVIGLFFGLIVFLREIYRGNIEKDIIIGSFFLALIWVPLIIFWFITS